MSLRAAVGWTDRAGSRSASSFAGVVYVMYENHWGGVTLEERCPPGHADGADASITYVSAYLLEQALSVDNLFVIALVFTSWKIPSRYQHRVLFWGILGAICFRFAMLSGGALVAARFHWVFYIFGAYLAYQGAKLMFGWGDDDAAESKVYKQLRKVVPIVEGKDHDYRFTAKLHGRLALTTVAVCLIVVELTDIVFALDSIPAVMSVTHEVFIMVTSNVFAILGLRSMYFVLARAMAKFKYLKYALAVLLIVIGGKMLLHRVDAIRDLPDVVWLGMIAGILAVGVAVSLVATRGQPAQPAEPSSP